MLKINIKAFLIGIIVLFVSFNVFADSPYEKNKNIRLSINDIDSEEVKTLYEYTTTCKI